ncbi:uncharacterized protein LOC125066585 [Vanessa atalanta]|uniref:uncharacterized protein LOC125066585 n=1 Tax=Vanessa atalanta TaxID=42275 RepID=UPI001FCDE6C4|nr:uncharacterized protein LOC125066585 [Vanessa atalanta]
MDIIFKVDLEDKFRTVIEDTMEHLYVKKINSTILNEQIIATAKKEIKELLIKSNFNNQKIQELLLSKGYNEERIHTFSSLIQNRRDELLYLTLVNLNSSYGETVAKFDWILKLVYGTSELKNLKYPLLQLALTTVNDGKCQQRNYDISKDMLIKIINVLENID